MNELPTEVFAVCHVSHKVHKLFYKKEDAEKELLNLIGVGDGKYFIIKMGIK